MHILGSYRLRFLAAIYRSTARAEVNKIISENLSIIQDVQNGFIAAGTGRIDGENCALTLSVIDNDDGEAGALIDRLYDAMKVGAPYGKREMAQFRKNNPKFFGSIAVDQDEDDEPKGEEVQS